MICLFGKLCRNVIFFVRRDFKKATWLSFFPGIMYWRMNFDYAVCFLSIKFYWNTNTPSILWLLLHLAVKSPVTCVLKYLLLSSLQNGLLNPPPQQRWITSRLVTFAATDSAPCSLFTGAFYWLEKMSLYSQIYIWSIVCCYFKKWWTIVEFYQM